MTARFLRLLLLSSLLFLFLASGARAADRYVMVKFDQPLHTQPSAGSPTNGTIGARDTLAKVLASGPAEGRIWLGVQAVGARGTERAGWVPEEATRPARAPREVSARLREVLNSQVKRAGATMLVVEAESGEVLYSHAATRRRTLASVTKLFVTGSALSRFGPDVGPELGRILRPSDNYRADRMARRVGGTESIRRYAASIGSRVYVRGGSGLDPRSRASATQVVNFLLAMRAQPNHTVWTDALPVAGRSGTLRSRMRGTPAEGKCQAKTGSLFRPVNVSALAGYCTTRKGTRIAFAILSREHNLQTSKSAEDRMLSAMVSSL